MVRRVRVLSADRNSENPVSQRHLIASRWRDPDSNRGHHDFQDSAQKSLTRRNPCIRAGCLSESIIDGLPLFADFYEAIGYRDHSGYPNARATATPPRSWRLPCPGHIEHVPQGCGLPQQHLRQPVDAARARSKHSSRSTRSRTSSTRRAGSCTAMSSPVRCCSCSPRRRC